MGDSYKKSKGNAGLDGVQFQLNLLTVCLLNAFRTKKNWKISTENKQAGKFDDLILDLHNESSLLQAKYKQNKKITKDQIFSCNSKNADFSLPKYFLSYLEIKSNIKKKTVVICTNTNIDEKGLENVLTRHRVGPDSMLHYEGTECAFFTVNANILPDLKASAENYFDKNLQSKSVDRAAITDGNIEDFLKNLQIFTNYPSGDKLNKVIEQLLFPLNHTGLRYKVSPREIHKKVEDWFKQPKGEYLTELRARAMFSEIKSDAYRERLKNYNVSFKRNDLDFTDTKRIVYVNSEGELLLPALKVYDALRKDESRKLFVDPDDGIEGQKQVIEAFNLPRYTFLIIIGAKNEVCDGLREILERYGYKKVILVGRSDKPTRRIGLNTISYVDGSVTFRDLSDECQRRLASEKNVIFQGDEVSLEELAPGSNWVRAVNCEILDKLIRKERIKVGERPLDLGERKSQYYVYRTFKRHLRESRIKRDQATNEEDVIETKEESVEEESIYEVNEPVVLIADTAGTGKTTVLTKLAIAIKRKNPRLWVIKIDLADYTAALRDFLTNRLEAVSVTELLNSKNRSKLNHLEEFVFSTENKVVLMLDGIDEISPDYTELVLNLLKRCREAPGLAKLFATTRPHLVRKLEEVLKVKPFVLQSFTVQNQVDFLTSYWAHNLEVDSENEGKCEQYARALISTMSAWTKSCQSKEDDFTAIPLHLSMLAEIFQESLDRDGWEGCKEYLQKTTTDPKLPERIEINTLYDLFVNKKRDVYVLKGNPCGNPTANKALIEQFHESLAYHQTLAIEAILRKDTRQLFQCYRQGSGDVDENILKIGIVQKSNEEFHFIHRTFAEYFMAQSLMEELQLQLRTPNVKFQEFFISEALQLSEYKVIRSFFDNFLQEVVGSIPPDIFRKYQSRAFFSYYPAHNTHIFHLLAEEGCVAILQLVLKCIDFKIVKDKEITVASKKKTVLQLFARKIGVKNNGKNTLKVLKTLAREAGVNIRDKSGRTPLHCAANGGHFEMVKFLSELGVNIDSRDSDGCTALNLAAAISHADIVEYLVRLGADVGIRNNSGRTSLHFASKSTRLDTVKYLMRSGGDANVEDNSGRTALHYAAAGSQLPIVEYLVKSSDTINTYDYSGRTALHFAAARDHLPIVEHLVKFSDNIDIGDHSGRTALHFAAAEGHPDNVACLLKSGSNVNVKDKSGRSALHYAAIWGHLSVVEDLVASGSDVDIKDKGGFTPLHFAIWRDRLEVVEYLVKSGGDVNVKNNEGYTTLHVAVLCFMPKIVDCLVKSGVDVNVKDNKGRTALHWAIEKGQLDIVKLLVECGADLNIKDDCGLTALQFATDAGHRHIVDYFESRNSESVNG